MRLLVLIPFAIAGCGSREPAPVAPMHGDWALLHTRTTCADVRNGISGYAVEQIVEGPRVGAAVIVFYGDSAEHASELQPSEWSVGRVRLAPTTIPGRWGSACELLPSPPDTRSGANGYAGVVITVTGYADETAARRAFAALP